MADIIRDEYGNTYKIKEDEHKQRVQLGKGAQGAVYKLDKYDNVVVKTVGVNQSSLQEDNWLLKNEKKYNNLYKKVLLIKSFDDIPHVASPLALLEKPCCGYLMRFMTDMIPIQSMMLAKDIIYKIEDPNVLLKLLAEESKELLLKKGALEDMHEVRQELFASLNTRSNRSVYENILRKQYGGLKRRLLILKNLARILCDLEKQSLVYCDISPKNVFISQNPEYAEVWLIDVDNLNYEASIKRSLYTPYYGAPEVVMGKKNTLRSDCYSFALLAYEFLTFSKAFFGKLYYDESSNGASWDSDDFTDDALSGDEKAERGLLPYVNDPLDDNNRTYAGVDIKNLQIPLLEDLFVQTFSEEGRKDPFARPTIHDWYKAIRETLLKIDKEDRENKKTYTLEVYDRFLFEKDEELTNELKCIEEKLTHSYSFEKPKKAKLEELPWFLFADGLSIDDGEKNVVTIDKNLNMKVVNDSIPLDLRVLQKINTADAKQEAYVYYKGVAIKHLVIK